MTTTPLNLPPASVNASSLPPVTVQVTLHQAPSSPPPAVPANDDPPSLSFPNNVTKADDALQHSFLPPDVGEAFAAVDSSSFAPTPDDHSQTTASLNNATPQLVLCAPKPQPTTHGPPAPHLNALFLDTAIAKFAVVDFVFGTLFLCEPTTINALKASRITDLPSIVNADPSHFLISKTIKNAEESQ